MFLLEKIGFTTLGLALGALGMISIVQPRKVVDFYSRQPGSKALREIQDELSPIKIRIIVTRVKGVFLILFGIAFIVIAIMRGK